MTPASRVLTDRGTEYCGNPERHEYELYPAIEDIDHSRTKTKSTQTKGIVERFNRTAPHEFYRIAFRKKLYKAIDALQIDWMFGWQSSIDSGRIWVGGALERRHCKPSLTPRQLLRGR
jgi:hypothetical protein